MRSVPLFFSPVFVLLFMLGLGAGLPLPAADTGISPSVRVRKEHPCLEQLITGVRRQLTALGSQNGTVYLDAFDNLGRALKSAGVAPAEAVAIDQLVANFRAGNVKGKTLRRMVQWLGTYSSTPSPLQITPPIQGPMRLLVCITDDKCSLVQRPASWSLFPFHDIVDLQTVLIAPRPKPGADPKIFLADSVVPLLGVAYGQEEFRRWLEAMHLLSEQGRERDALARAFVSVDDATKQYSFSPAFRAIVMKFVSRMITIEMVEEMFPGDPVILAQNLAIISQYSFQEIQRMQFKDAVKVAEALGITCPESFFPVAMAVLTTMTDTQLSLAAQQN